MRLVMSRVLVKLILPALAFATPVAERNGDGQTPYLTVKTQGSGAQVQTTLMWVRFPAPAKFIGFPQVCPGDDGSEKDENEICTAVLYQGGVWAAGHLSGPEIRGKFRLRYPAHASPMARGSYLLIAAYPFEDGATKGIFARWWSRTDDKGEVCLEDTQIKTLSMEVAFTNARKRVIIGEGDGKHYPVSCIRPK